MLGTLDALEGCLLWGLYEERVRRRSIEIALELIEEERTFATSTGLGEEEGAEINQARTVSPRRSYQPPDISGGEEGQQSRADNGAHGLPKG